MTGFGTSRRETTKIRDSAHPEYDPESSIDSTTIPSQMGSNKYASQKGMTGFGQPRWEVFNFSIISLFTNYLTKYFEITEKIQGFGSINLMAESQKSRNGSFTVGYKPVSL